MFAKREKPLTKSDLVEYIGPIFQDLKGGLIEKIERLGSKIDSVNTQLTDKISSVDNKLTDKINSVTQNINLVDSKLTDKINWQGTLMEQMNKKIDLALEFTERTTQNDISIKEHSTKIENLEAEVGAIKIALKMPSH
jgi:hypothetical protein